MSQAAAFGSAQLPAVLEPAGPSDSMRGAATLGWLIIVVFFGVFGTWAVTAPLNGAVVADGIVKVEGNRKSVQHFDGGIVKEMRVKEGDTVKVDEVLIVLDDSQARVEFQVLSEQFVVLRATEERLWAERDLRPELVLPADLKTLPGDQHVESVWAGQIRQFESRLAALDGQRKIIEEKIAQIGYQIVGGEAQVKSFRAQLASIQDEVESLSPLLYKGLIARPRYLQLERTAAGLEGQVLETLANIAKLKQAIAEQHQQIAQLDNNRMDDVTKDLRDTQVKLLEVNSRLVNARGVLGRTEIRAPYAGRVVALNVFSIGGVIQRGDKIMDIVPERNVLIVEAQVAVEDISELRSEMRAEVHLTAYKQRITPVIHGDVIEVSADRLTDNRTGRSYFVAAVRVDEIELADMPNIQLYPGMAATVMIPTTKRTAFDYLVGPFVMSFNHSFRQR